MNYFFHLIYDLQNYILANYFINFKTIKSNLDRFINNLLIIPFIEKLSYQNANKLIKKFQKYYATF